MKNLLSGIFILMLTFAFSTPIIAQEYGVASFYSDEFHGRKTAYGDTYDKEKLTAAHKKHPYGTILKITRLDNKKSVTVKVTDKGPYIKGRVVDVSRRAAEKLGLVKVGMAEVKVEVVNRMERSTSTVSSASKPSRSSRSATKKVPDSFDEPVAVKKPSSKKTSLTEKGATAKKTSSKKSASSSSKSKMVTKDYKKYGLYKIELKKPNKAGYGVQIAAVSNYENVLKHVAELQAKWFENILVSVEPGKGKPIYKIILGPLDNEKSANTYRSSLKKKHKINGFVINLEEITY